MDYSLSIPLLQRLAERYETADFIKGDPSWFMHQVSGAANQETLGFIASCLSYGSRKQFFPKIQFILDSSYGDVHQWLMTGKYKRSISDNNNCYYRLYTCHDMIAMLNTLHDMIEEYNTIGNFLKANAHTGYEAVKAFTEYFQKNGATPILPHSATSACKRICMYLRWMVRDNSPVDLGLWTFIDKRTLIMPLDTHVMHEACNLGFMNSHNTNMNTALKLTAVMSHIFPNDPLKGDFALFGLGINK
jgi:uncharacterized protein (TIGR02757 family)